ncbi:MAG TPA: Hpt domain-containing protein, partial [Verrucomicrobiae bacterium]|nr:Hpt domain-containing protein [Verrucomicrobiae bacterium]
MDDFYAECDEHLGEVRGALLQLEPSIGVGPPDSTTLLRLFHSFHSLKGIFGMAGLREAESLAHRTEDYLRSLTRHQASFTEHGFDVLTSAIEFLERTIVAHREGASPVEISPVLDELGKLVEGSPTTVCGASTAIPPELEGKLQKARNSGLTVWHCLFEPSQELAQQGKSINTARARLEALGEILFSAPRVEGAGRILFEFIVAGAPGEENATTWSDEGIRLRPYDVATPTLAPSLAAKAPEPSATASVAPS